MSDAQQEDREVPEPSEAATLPDLEATAEAVRGGVKWEGPDFDAVRAPAPKPVIESIGGKYTT